jgi:hypothetical protein
VPTGDISLTSGSVHVVSADVTLQNPPLVKLVLSSAKRLEVDDVDELKALISGKIGEPFQLEVQSNILR